eukprot:Gb_16969 [translate_table: standard]
MPKDLQQCNSLVSRKARKSCHHPYNSPGKTTFEGSTSKDGETNAQKKEWDDATCPICMEHPHNAVLLLCSSFDQGCRSYMCDTSYRHSNCLDQYRKPRANCRNNMSQGVEVYMDSAGSESMGLRSLRNSDEDIGLGRPGRARRVLSRSWRSRSGDFQETENRRATRSLFEWQPDRISDGIARDNPTAERDTETVESSSHHINEIEAPVNGGVELKCPLCRGTVSGWKVVEEARQYLNSKTRSCSRESCSFSGTYEELRKHARSDHPTTRPSEIDPSRQRAWRHLEHQRDYGDVLSTIRSAMPGAVVLGDYVIDGEDGIHLDRSSESDALSNSGPWWTTFFLFHMIGPIASLEDARGFPSRWRASRRQHMPSGALAGQPNLWGENIVGAGNEETDNNSTNDAANGATGSRRTRRLTRSRPDDLQ